MKDQSTDSSTKQGTMTAAAQSFPEERSTHRCSNCGTPKQGEYCFNCGQNSRNYRRSAHRIGGEVLAEVFDFDSRLFRSLGYLLFRPGTLTKEFVAGRRAKYLSPGRLYVVMSVIFFTLLSVLGGGDFKKMDLQISDQVKTDILSDIAGGDDTGSFAPQMQQKVLALLENPAVSYQAFVNNLPIAMFFLLPLFALLMKLFYPRNYYAQHLVFALHLHSFFFFVFSLRLLIPDVGVQIMTEAAQLPNQGGNPTTLDNFWKGLESLLNLSCLVYFLLALKNTYGQSFGMTLVKISVLGFTYFVLLLAGLTAVLAVTVLLL